MLFQGFASAHGGRHGNSAATALLKLDTGCNGKRWCFTVLAKTVSRAYTGIQTFFGKQPKIALRSSLPEVVEN